MDQHEHLADVPTYLYILGCQNDTFYVGITHDLVLRFRQHLRGTHGVHHIKMSGVDRMIMAILFGDREMALNAERFVTYYFKAKRQSSCSDAAAVAWLDHYYSEASQGVWAVLTSADGRLLDRLGERPQPPRPSGVSIPRQATAAEGLAESLDGGVCHAGTGALIHG